MLYKAKVYYINLLNMIHYYYKYVSLTYIYEGPFCLNNEIELVLMYCMF